MHMEIRWEKVYVDIGAKGLTKTLRQVLVTQRAKKVVSDSPGLVDFAIGLVNSVFNLPDGQVIFF